MRRQILDIGRDYFWYLLATVGSSLIAFLAVPILTRVLLPSEYGVYSLVASTIVLVSNLGSVWLVMSIVRFYPVYERENRLQEYYSTIYHYVPHLLTAVLLIALPLIVLFVLLGRYRSVIFLGVADNVQRQEAGELAEVLCGAHRAVRRW